MRTPTRASVAGALAIVALVIATTVSLAGNSSGGGQDGVPVPDGGPTGSTGSSGSLGMCVAPEEGTTQPDTPVCNDVITVPNDPIPLPEPQIVEPTPGMADVYARIFDSATVADDDVTVSIDFVSGIEPCYALDHVDVAYGDRSVTITLFEGHDPSAGDVACIEIGVFKRVVITLDEPLGGRAIVDGAAG
jgi:hypothetical protein